MPVKGIYLTKHKSKWMEICHLPSNPKNCKGLRLAGYTSRNENYSEVIFNIVSWNRLYALRYYILISLEEESEFNPFRFYLNQDFYVELCVYHPQVGKVLCFIQNHNRIYMKLRTFSNLMSYDSWLQHHLESRIRNFQMNS